MSIDNLDNNDTNSQVPPTIEILNSSNYWVKTTSEQPVKPFSGVTLTDANADATETVTITFGDGGDSGTLTGDGLSLGEGGVYTLKGSAADVTEKLHNLVFTPVEGKPLYTTFTYFTLTAQNSAGDPPVIAEVAGVQNADPAVTIKGAVANQFTEAEAPINPFSGMKITDAIPGKTETLTITLSDGAGGFGGTLDGGGSAVVAAAQFHGGNGVYTLSGSASVVTAALKALIFTPNKGEPNTRTTTTFTLSDKNADAASPVINNTTTVINVDPPVAPTITAPKQSLLATSDEGVKPFANVTLTDKNADATEFLTIVVTGDAGTLSGDGLRYIGNATYALIGSVAEVESQLKNLTFTPDGKQSGVATFLLNATSNIDEQALTTSDEITVTVMVTDTDMAMAVGDFDNDGKQDIAFTNYTDNTVSILLGDGKGSFPSKVSYATGQGPVAVSVGDFNHDGKLDLVVANARENTASILLGKGDGTFQPQTRYATGNLPFSASVADVDNDGFQDLIIANHSGDNTISVLLGKGDGTFKSQMTYATGNGATGVAMGDFNNDGKLDIVVGNYGDNTLSVLLGKGDGTFNPQTTYATGKGPTGVAAGDFNNDGKLDIVVGNYGDNTLSVLLGKGDGTFQPQVTYETGKNPASFSVADFDADGDLDIVVQNYGDNTVSIMTGNGDGTFQPQVTIPMDFPLGPIAISDVNGDGQLDIIVSNLKDKTTPDFFNTTHAVPTITGAHASQSTGSKTPIKPFAGVTITDDNELATEKLIITMSGGGTLTGEGLTNNGDGTYTLTGSAADVASLLQGLTFTPDGKHPGAVTTFSLTDKSIVDGRAIAQSEATTVSVTDTGPFIPTITPINGSNLSNLSTTSDAPIRPFLLQIDGPRNTDVHSVKIEVTGVGGELSYEFGPLSYSEEGQYYWGKAKYGDFQWLLTHTTFIPKAGAPATQSETHFKITFFEDENLQAPIATYDQISVINIDPPVAPTITAPGTSLRANAEIGVNPFADVTLADTNAGATEKLTITMSGGGGTLAGAGLTNNGDGTYTLTGSAAEVARLLRGLTFIPDGKNIGDVTTFSLVDTSLVNGVEVASSAPVTVGVTELAAPVTPTVSFATQTTFGTGDAPQLMAFGDFNHDGKQDIVVTNYNDNSVSVLLGNGDGTFQQKLSYATGRGPVGVSVGDFDHDGKLDIAVANTGEKTVSILLGKSDGTFQSQTRYATGNYPFSTSVADVDKDGIPDLIVTNYSSDNTISVLLGKGDGTFKSQVTSGTGNHPNTVFAADFNGDGDRDIVVTNLFDDTVLVLLGNGDGSFQREGAYSTGDGPTGVAAGDFNRDGKLDLVIANYYGNTVSVLLGNGDGTFQQQKTYATGRTPAALQVADVNGDGTLDIVVQNYNDNTISVLLGNGEGTFQPQKTLAVGSGPGSVVVNDFNGDGQPDIVVSNMSDGTISVLLNTTHAVPTISGATAGQSTDSKTPINPFAGVTISDANANATEKLTITRSGGAGTLAGEGLTDNGDGTYTLTGPAADVANLLHALTFTPDGQHPGAVTTFSLTDQSIVDGRPVSTSNEITVTVTDTDPLPHIPTSDVNGDHHSDIVLQNTGGAVYVWQMGGGANGLGITANGFIGGDDGPGAKWQVKATGDFDGDGKSDLLLQYKDTGAVYVWEMNGKTIKAGGFIGGDDGPGAKWQVKATGDFDGDGHSDILMQYADTGACFVWQTGDDGMTVKKYGFIGGEDGPGAKWQVKGTGDFNGDGKSDILLQYADTGACYVWEMGDGADGLTIKAGGFVGGEDGPGAKWQVKGVGDFNGDGRSDILMQYADTGACFVWQTGDDGLTVKKYGFIGGEDGPGAKWEVKSTGDFDGDGKSDILLQYADTGACYVWEMGDNGLTIKAGGFVGGSDGPGADWHARA